MRQDEIFTTTHFAVQLCAAATDADSNNARLVIRIEIVFFFTLCQPQPIVVCCSYTAKLC